MPEKRCYYLPAFFFNSFSGEGSSNGLLVGLSQDDAWFHNYEDGSLNLGTNGATRLVIKPTGKVGIGTLDPSSKLSVAGLINLNQGISGERQAIKVNGDEALWYNGTYFSWGYSAEYNYFARKIAIGTSSNPGSHKLVVNGTAGKPGGGSWSSWSDARLKDIHGKYTPGLDEISKLEPVRYNYKSANPIQLPVDKEYAGLIAQEVRKVFPEAVSEGADGYLQLDMHPVNIALINAVKELKEENEELRERLDRLEEIMSTGK